MQIALIANVLVRRTCSLDSVEEEDFIIIFERPWPDNLSHKHLIKDGIMEFLSSTIVCGQQQIKQIQHSRYRTLL